MNLPCKTKVFVQLFSKSWPSETKVSFRVNRGSSDGQIKALFRTFFLSIQSIGWQVFRTEWHHLSDARAEQWLFRGSDRTGIKPFRPANLGRTPAGWANELPNEQTNVQAHPADHTASGGPLFVKSGVKNFGKALRAWLFLSQLKLELMRVGPN